MGEAERGFQLDAVAFLPGTISGKLGEKEMQGKFNKMISSRICWNGLTSALMKRTATQKQTPSFSFLS